jgi:hypothetical protein
MRLVYARSIPLGTCEAIDDERVLTNFMFLIAVLVPLDTIYTVGSRLQGAKFQVKRSAKSILFTYARGLAPLIVLITAIALGAPDKPGPLELGTGALVTLALMTAGCLALVLATGRVRGRAARQQRVLRAHVGVAVKPEILLDGTLGLVLDDLERAWSDAAGASAWRELFPKDVPSNELALYYALCRYHAALSGEPIFENRARIAWERLEAEPKLIEAAIAREVKRPSWLAELDLPLDAPGYALLDRSP